MTKQQGLDLANETLKYIADQLLIAELQGLSRKGLLGVMYDAWDVAEETITVLDGFR
jgi:hypothetical protein